jgi:hypothetical protein
MPKSIMGHLSPRSRKHAHQMLAAISDANAKGKWKLVEHLTAQFLRSHDARLFATLWAYKSLPIGRRPDELNVTALAEALFPAKGSNEPVRLSIKRKGESGSGDYRLLMGFGLENRALQYLIRAPLTKAANLHPHQYGTIGVQAAISRVAKLMSTGYLWGVEIDIKNCFQSFNEEKLHEYLPISKEVIRHVAMSRRPIP